MAHHGIIALGAMVWGCEDRESCEAGDIVGQWRVEYAVSDPTCHPGNDDLVPSTDGSGAMVFDFHGGEQDGSFDPDTCTIWVHSYANWDDGGEPQSDERHLELYFEGDTGTGTLVYAAWWFCGDGEPEDHAYEATARRADGS